MHIIAGLIGALLGVLYIVDRLGIDIGWLNPWAWRRRRAWARKFESDPIYSIEEPMHIAAVIVVGVAKLDGDITSDQKTAILNHFEKEFSLDSRGASELLGSVTHLLGAPQVIRTQLEGLVSRNRQTFAPEQAESVIDMTAEIASVGHAISDEQLAFIEHLRTNLSAPRQSGKWR